MDRTPLACLLHTHRVASAQEAAWRDAVLALLADVDDPFSRRTFEPGHVTASAFVLSPDGGAVLLIRHRTLGRWLQPGGHVEASDPDIVAAARREVVEETGVEALHLAPGDPWLLDIDVHDIPANPAKGEPAHQHFDVRVLFQAHDLALRDTGEVDGVAWVDLDAVTALETDDSVRRAIARLRARRVTPDARRDAPATHRNRGPILDVLRGVVRPGDTVLELGCGTGQHAAAFAPALHVGAWWPADLDDAALASAAAWTAGVPGVRAPVRFDARHGVVPAAPAGGFDVVFSANLIHIAPRDALDGLLSAAATALRPGGHLVLYGPFRALGGHTSESNASFDADLRARHPSWGVWDLEHVVAEAARVGLAWAATDRLPANNLAVRFVRRDPSTGVVDPEAAALLDHWFGGRPHDPSPDTIRRWWSHDPEADAFLASRFGALHARAASGALDAWACAPRGRLALVILLDQVSRQIHRDTPGMFASDDRALAFTLDGLARGDDHALGLHERMFLYMPLMHAEDRAVQALSIAAFRDLADDGRAAGRDAFGGNLDFAHRHRVIVDRFGHYPHRNAILGRATTPEEAAFLAQPGSSF